MRFACFVSVVALGLAAGAAAADDTVPNPEFTNWSKFKKGTSVTIKTTATAAGVTSETFSTSTLIEVGADKVVVEYAMTTVSSGAEVKAPTSKRDIPKTIAKAKTPNKDDPKIEVASEEGAETIKILGRELKTKWRKNTVEVGGTKSVSKIWMSDEVPGTMVKMETTVTGAVASTIKAELVEFKQP